jgi:hypothetical protein
LFDAFSEEIVGCFYPVGFPVESVKLDVWSVEEHGCFAGERGLARADCSND